MKQKTKDLDNLNSSAEGEKKQEPMSRSLTETNLTECTQGSTSVPVAKKFFSESFTQQKAEQDRPVALLLEDGRIQKMIIKSRLESFGFSVIVFNNGVEFIDEVKKNPNTLQRTSLIVSDNDMTLDGSRSCSEAPYNGTDALKALHKHCNDSGINLTIPPIFAHSSDGPKVFDGLKGLFSTPFKAAEKGTEDLKEFIMQNVPLVSNNMGCGLG